MPEIPDLEALRALLTARLQGVVIARVEAPRAVVVRAPVAELRRRLEGRRVERIERRGKFLLVHVDTRDVLVVNAMLTGHWQDAAAAEKRPARTCVVLGLSDGRELRYVDERFMGKMYMVGEDALATVPQFAEMGPDALDPSLDEAAFLARLRRFRGQVKSVLVNQRFVAGIGNAYADEILFVAGIHPFTRVATLDAPRRRALYGALHAVMDWAIPQVREALGGDLGGKPREFLRVHRKGGTPCPQCGAPISEISAGQRITSFCRRCQPG